MPFIHNLTSTQLHHAHTTSKDSAPCCTLFVLHLLNEPTIFAPCAASACLQDLFWHVQRSSATAPS
jgi:hypothetical protein